jgi:hypothetical protein
MYVLVPMVVSMILIIKVVDIPCRNSPYYVVYTCTWILEPSVYLSGYEIE